MTETSGGELQAAYEAIRAEDFANARDILSAYLVDHPNDADAWWLYAHAVSDAAQGQKALETVVRLDPKYPGAQELLDEATTFDFEPLAEHPFPIRPLTSVGTEARPATAATVQPPSKGGSRIGWLVGAIVLLVLVAAVVLLLPRLNPPAGSTPTTVASASETPTGGSAAGSTTDTPEVSATDTETPALETATDAPQVPTDAPTEQPTDAVPTATVEPATDVPTESTSDGSSTLAAPSALEGALSGFRFVPGSETQTITSLGTTAIADVCAESASIRSLIPSAIVAVAAAAPQLPVDVGGLALRFVDCNANQSVIRFVGVSGDDARAFSAGEITDEDLRTRIVVNP